ncbi:MAG: hypothetical protein RIQ71_2595, partial [Verrucomicrobiota bacterium]
MFAVVATPKIKDWPEDERPREKLVNRGAEALSDSELLAIFLRTGTPGRTAVDVGAEMIKSAGGSLARMASLGVKELRKLAKGVGLAKACEMAAAFEVGKRLARQTAQSEQLGTPEKIYGFMGPLLQ